MRDEKIIAAIRQREGDVMNEVINKYSRLLWKISSAVLQNVGCEQDVEECVADAFIYLWENPDKFDLNRGKLKSILCIIVRSRSIDRYRQLLRLETVPLEDVFLADHFEIQEALFRQEIHRELVTAVNALGEPGREILIRRYYNDQKPREIALALGMTVKQVDNSLYRSKRSLRKTLEGNREVTK